MIFLSQMVPINKTLPIFIVFFLPTLDSECSFDSQRDLLIWDRDLFSIFCTFVHWNFSKHFFETYRSKVGSTEIWTRVFGFRVQGASHYTTEAITLFFEIWIVPNDCWLHDPFWKELFGKKWYFCSQIVPRNRTLPIFIVFSPDIGFRAQFWFTTRFTNLRSRPFFHFLFFCSLEFFKTFFSKLIVQKLVLPRFELGSLDSGSKVLAITPQERLRCVSNLNCSQWLLASWFFLKRTVR